MEMYMQDLKKDDSWYSAIYVFSEQEKVQVHISSYQQPCRECSFEIQNNNCDENDIFEYIQNMLQYEMKFEIEGHPFYIEYP